MRIFTHTCPACGTIVSANVLETNRVMKCPGLECQTVLSFDDLPEAARQHVLEYRERYQF